jgi:formate--tetrahydrofolate ligase
MTKIEVITKEIYRAEEVFADQKICNQLEDFEKDGFGHLPVCMAKTQYSFSTDPALKGAPSGYGVSIREVRISSGAEFILVFCGAIMTMPGLPRIPAAEAIEIDEDGLVQGLF